jgi:hypothetical protein
LVVIVTVAVPVKAAGVAVGQPFGEGEIVGPRV